MIIPQNLESRPVAVIGAGTLGRRIAVMFANRGGRVNIVDPVSTEVLEAAKCYVDEVLPGVVENMKSEGENSDASVGTVTYSQDVLAAVSDAWLIVEAIPEKLEIKNDLFESFKGVVAEDAIVATNSSSYASSTMVDHVPDPERFLNLHFYQPPEYNHLDLMSCGQTSRGVIDFLLEHLPKHDIYPHEVMKESTGFLFNRIWAAIKRESLAVLGEGVGTAEDIDAMFKSWFKAENAPFEMMDAVGLDVVLAIEEHYAEELPWTNEAARSALKKKIVKGELGVKSGQGFYSH